MAYECSNLTTPEFMEPDSDCNIVESYRGGFHPHRGRFHPHRGGFLHHRGGSRHHRGRFMWPWQYFTFPVATCGCETSTIPNPDMIANSIRGGVYLSECEPGSETETCYCRDTCFGNPDTTSRGEWWNCSSPKIGGLGVPWGTSCNIK